MCAVTPKNILENANFADHTRPHQRGPSSDLHPYTAIAGKCSHAQTSTHTAAIRMTLQKEIAIFWGKF